MISTYTTKELDIIRKYRTPEAVQKFIKSLEYNLEKDEESIRSFRRVVRDRKAHCLEGAITAATILGNHGFGTNILDLVIKGDVDHVVYIYGNNGKYGSIGQSREKCLLGKPAKFNSVEELVKEYHKKALTKTKGLYSFAIADLDEIYGANWRFGKRNLWVIERYLHSIKHKLVKS